MAQQTAIKIRRSSVASKIPLTTDLVLGELALNTYDGVIYFKKSPGGTDSIVAVTTLDGTQTLTNKTLTSPTINAGALSGTFSGNHTLSGVVTLSNTTDATSTTAAGTIVSGGLAVAKTIYADQIRVLNNGAGTNIYVGDDAIIGDINAANTFGVRGQQDVTKGYIVFGNANNNAYIGRDGTNPITVTGQFSVNSGTVTGSNAIGLQISGYAQKGGVGYNDFLSVTNSYSSATNPNKFFRLNQTGGLEIINSAYSTNIFTLTDAGELSVPSFSLAGTFKDSTGSVGTNNQILKSTGTGVQWVTSSAGSSGTVTSVSVVSANGFTGTVANNSTTPAITITTSINGVLKGNGTSISAATAGTDYLAPGSLSITTASASGGGSLSYSSGVFTFTPPDLTSYITATSTTTFSNKTFDTAGTGNVFKINGTQVSAVTGSGSVVLASNPTLTTPTLGAASATTINKVTITTPANGSTLTIADGKTLTASNTLTFTGTDSSTIAFGAGGTVLYASTTGQTITDTSGGTNYTLKIANGTTGSVFGIGTGSNAYGIANDALNNTITGYVPYTVSASTITFKAGATPATALSIASTGAVTIGTLTGLLKGTSGVISAAAASDINSTFGSQTQNYVYAAPSGSNGNPTFRALIAADLPPITNLAGGTTGAITYQSGTNATAFLSGNTSTTPQFVTSTGTGSAAQAPTLTSSTGSGSVVLATSPTFTTGVDATVGSTSFFATPTSPSLFAAGTAISIGATTGTTTVRNNLKVNGSLDSNLIPSTNTTYDLGSSSYKWNNLYVNKINDLVFSRVEGKTYYVTQSGDDTSTGTSIQGAFATIKKALTVATAGDSIKIGAGTYTEIFPLTVPAGVSIVGLGIRSTKIVPTTGTKNKDAFLLSGEIGLSDFTIADFFYDAVNDTGYAFRFVSSAVITSRSPYIQRITVLCKGSTTTASDPYGFTSGDAGRGALIDGSQVTRASIEAAMLFNECTFIVPNSRALIMKNGARAEWLTCFTYFADLAIEGLVGSTGRGGSGKTYLTLSNATGTWNVGNTLSYYATDGTTLLASATIEAINGSVYQLAGSISGFTTYSSRTTKVITINGSAKLSTAQQKFGTASLVLDGVNSFLSLASSTDFAYATGNFTIEFWFYRTTSGTVQTLYDQRTANSVSYCPLITITNSNYLTYNNGTSTVITGATAVPLNAWSHVAVSRSGTSTKLFLNGVQQGSTYTDSLTYIATPIRIGARYDGTVLTTGYIDEVRVSKGIARYTTAFTPSSSAFVSDQYTVLLLHLDGANNSTSIVDDGSNVQDIRSSGGGTATGITRYDRKEFAAELRSISSANIYGNQGVKANGVDVKLQLMAHNFAYIGTGADLTNNSTAVVQANEVIEINSGRVYYNTVDQSGNFRVGQLFSVNFETGAVTFSGSSFDVSSLVGINFTDGTNSTIVDATHVATGNLILSGNTLSSQTGSITIDPSGTQPIYLNGNTTITGNLGITGYATLNGATSGTITVLAPSVAGTNTITLPAATDTLVGQSTTDTLTNKTLSSVVLTGTVTANGVVGTTGQVLSSTGTGVQWIDAGGSANAVSYTSQTLNTAQQAQARTNINAISLDEAYMYSLIF